MVDGEPWPGLGHASVLEAVRAHPLWRGRSDLPDGEGVGVALGVWPGGKAPAAALCRLNADGSITITTGVVDMSGTTGAFQIIAAETFGVDPSTGRRRRARHRWRAPVAAEWRQRHHLLRRAGRSAKRRPTRAASCSRTPRIEMEIDPADLEIVDGVVRPVGSPDRGRPIAEFAEELHDFGSQLPAGRGPRGDRPDEPRAVDGRAPRARPARPPRPATSTVLGYVVAQDVGRALNPALVEGQMRGAAAPGHRLGAARGADPRRRGPAADRDRSSTTRCRARRQSPTSTR